MVLKSSFFGQFDSALSGSCQKRALLRCATHAVQSQLAQNKTFLKVVLFRQRNKNMPFMSCWHVRRLVTMGRSSALFDLLNMIGFP